MDDLDLEKLKQELDDVSGGSVYNVDDILREEGASESVSSEKDLVELMKQFGIQADGIQQEADTKSIVQEKTAAVEKPVVEQEYTQPVQAQVTWNPAKEDDAAVSLAANQMQDFLEEQSELAGDSQEEMDALEEQDNVFAQLFAQLGEIEDEPEDTLTKPVTNFVDPRIEMDEDNLEEEPDLMDRLFQNMPKAQDMMQSETQDTIESEDDSEDSEGTQVFEEKTVEKTKKGFFTKLFSDDKQASDGKEVEEVSEISKPESTEVFMEDESEQSMEEAEETPKKGFFAKLFGDDEDVDNEEEDDEKDEVLEALEQAESIVEDQPEEQSTIEEPQEESIDEEVEENPKKGFFAKLFGDDEDVDDEEEDDEEDEVLQALEQAESIVEEQPEEQPTVEESLEESIDEEEEEVEGTPKKGFFAKLFGDDEDVDDEEEDEEDEVLEALEQAESIVEEQPEDQPVVEEQLEEPTEAFVEAEPEEQPEQVEKTYSMRPEDTPIISQQELEEFLSDVDAEKPQPCMSFEDILRGNGIEVEQSTQTKEPESQPEEQPEQVSQINLEEFPEEETTVYLDVSMKESAMEQPEQQPEELEESGEEQPEQAVEPEEIVQPEPDPDWLNVPLEQVCQIAPPLDFLRMEGPVMAREVARQRALHESNAAYLQAKREAQNVIETTEEQVSMPQQAKIDALDEVDQLCDALEHTKDSSSVFNEGSTDKPNLEAVDREIIPNEEESFCEQESFEQTEDALNEKNEPTENKRKWFSFEQPQKKTFIPWPQEQAPHDVHKASKDCSIQARKQAKRSIAVAILSFISIYLCCAADFALPLPAVLDYVENPFNVLLCLIVLMIVAMILCYDVIKEGIVAALYGSANFSTLVTLAILFNFIHCVVRLIWEGEEMPYACVAMIALFAQLRMRVAYSGTKHYTYKVASATQQPMGIFKRYGKTDCLVKIPMQSTDSFVHKTVVPQEIRKVESIITLLSIVACAVLSLLVCVTTGDFGRLMYVLAATFTGAAQVALLCAIPIGCNRAAHHMAKNGCAVNGLHGVHQMSSVNTVVLSDEDVFPNGTVALERVELCSNLNDTTAIAYAAALAGQSSLGHMLSEELRARYGKPLVAHEVIHYAEGGIGGQIGGLEILMGNHAFMKERGIAVTELPENGLAIAVEGELAAILVVDYHASGALFNAVQMLAENKIHIMLHSRNNQVTPEMVERLYGLQKGMVCAADLEFDRGLHRSRRQNGDELCAIQVREGIAALSDCIVTAKAQTRLSVGCAIIGVIASVVCMLLMAYMCYVFIPTDARPIRMLLYAILWFIPVFFMENGIGRD